MCKYIIFQNHGIHAISIALKENAENLILKEIKRTCTFANIMLPQIEYHKLHLYTRKTLRKRKKSAGHICSQNVRVDASSEGLVDIAQISNNNKFIYTI